MFRLQSNTVKRRGTIDRDERRDFGDIQLVLGRISVIRGEIRANRGQTARNRSERDDGNWDKKRDKGIKEGDKKQRGGIEVESIEDICQTYRRPRED